VAWTWERIKSEWLGESRVAFPPEDVVGAFDRVEALVGREWMLAGKGGSMGSLTVLPVVSMGQMLASLQGAANIEGLVRKLRQHNPSAHAELLAIHLLARGRSDTAIEVEPEVAVGGRPKVPDFRVSAGGTQWTYVEVTRPDISQANKEANGVMADLAELVREIEDDFALEVYLRHTPTPEELGQIRARLPEFCRQSGPQRESIGDLGFLLLNRDPPGVMVVRDHPGEHAGPMVAVMRAITGGGGQRHIAVRLAFADERAALFIGTESGQLPQDAPGILMVHDSNLPGGRTAWEPIVVGEFQPALNTRVSALCMFGSAFELSDTGETWRPDAKLILNPHACHPLPQWIVDQLSQFGSGHRPQSCLSTV